LGLLFALKGAGPRPFYRWLSNNYRSWFPNLPERTRLFRLLTTHAEWTEYFLAQPTTLGVADTYGIELIHPWREDRTDSQIGRKGLSNHRWIVGAKLAYLVKRTEIRGVSTRPYPRVYSACWGMGGNTAVVGEQINWCTCTR
jgi:hypothetical protein